MPNDYFDFKQFRIIHSGCAMKVGTDGVLIGAWAEGGKRILDIGTGTGLIAMMMAQRFESSQVTGIDIDKGAVKQASENVASSRFSDRIGIYECDVCSKIAPEALPYQQYDCIVSNPPFFEDSLECPNEKRSMARHTAQMPFNELFKVVANILTQEGIFSLIVPTDRVSKLTGIAAIHGLHLCRRCDIKTVERKEPKRTMLAFSHIKPINGEYTTVCLMANGERSEWYRTLTADFYLS